MSENGEIGNNNDATPKALRKFEKEFKRQMKIAELDRECLRYCIFATMARKAAMLKNEQEKDKAIDMLIAFIVENKLKAVHEAHESCDQDCDGWPIFIEVDPINLHRLARYMASDLECYYPKNYKKDALDHAWRGIRDSNATDDQINWLLEQAMQATGVTLIDDFLPLDNPWTPDHWLSHFHVIELMLKIGLTPGSAMLSIITSRAAGYFCVGPHTPQNAKRIAALINNTVKDNEPPAKKVKNTE
jgi:hypothetical protein